MSPTPSAATQTFLKQAANKPIWLYRVFLNPVYSAATTTGSTILINDTARIEPTNYWTNKYIRVTFISQSGNPREVRKVASSVSGASMTVSQAFSYTVTAEDEYEAGDFLFFANYDANVVFPTGKDVTYTARPISHEALELTKDFKVNETTVTTVNSDNSMSAYIAATQFAGRRLEILIVNADDLDADDDCITIFEGVMDAPSLDEHNFSIDVVSDLDASRKIIPWRRCMYFCQWRFASTECGAADGATSGTSDAGSTTVVLVDAAVLTQADDYWKYGILEITSGNCKGQKRLIVSSSQTGTSVTVDYPFSETIGTGITYIVKRGCDKTPEMCEDVHTNLDRYGGFLSVPKLDHRPALVLPTP